MACFSEIIKVNTDELFFNFNSISASENLQFFVTVALSGSSSVSFDMKKSESGHWNIDRKAPKWILKLEPELSEVIMCNTHHP